MAFSSFFLLIKKLEILFVSKLYFRFKGYLVKEIKVSIHKIRKMFYEKIKGKAQKAFQSERIKNMDLAKNAYYLTIKSDRKA